MREADQPRLPDGVTWTNDGALARLDVDTPACTAQVYLQGAHVTRWAPAGADPVLFLSSASRFEPGVAIRGGIPLCAPWFGPGRSKDKEPAHGWFRVATWTLADATTDGDDVVVTFTLDGRGASVPDGEPRDVTARYVVTLGRTLRLALTVTAGGDGLDLEDALHTYLAVSDVREVTVDGLDGTRYADKAPGGRAVNAQSGPLRLTRETDRVYTHDGDITVHDPGAGRRITVTKDGSASTIIWNPWATRAATIGDLGDDEWPRLLCVETANALRGYVPLTPGASHTTTATLAVEPA